MLNVDLGSSSNGFLAFFSFGTSSSSSSSFFFVFSFFGSFSSPSFCGCYFLGCSFFGSSFFLFKNSKSGDSSFWQSHVLPKKDLKT
jgi:hypothetical protein